MLTREIWASVLSNERVGKPLAIPTPDGWGECVLHDVQVMRNGMTHIECVWVWIVLDGSVVRYRLPGDAMVRIEELPPLWTPEMALGRRVRGSAAE